MLRNYFKTAWRNLLKSKFYSLINMAGLTVGLAVGILILLWVNDERSFNGFNSQEADIYRVELFGGTGASKQIWPLIPSPMGTFAKAELPQVVEQARIFESDLTTYFYGDKSFLGEKARFIDPSFFSVFDFPLVEGNASQPFTDVHSVVITQQTARKFFGEEPAMGKVFKAENNETYTVSGVIKDPPRNSDIQFDLLMPMERLARFLRERGADINHDFGTYRYMTFLQLRPGASPAGLPAKLTKIHLRNMPGDTDADYLLLPLSKMHLYNADGSDAGAQTVNIFMIVALLILSIACINYVNLSTARAMLRSKEVSMRKIVGAAKIQLFLQFVVETALLFLFSALLAVVLVRLAMPLFNQVAGKQLVFDITNGAMWRVIGYTIGATLLASSIYPALLLSSFDPLKALRSRLSVGGGDVVFRKVLVIIQFACSVSLIVGTLVIYRQLNYIRHKDLGYDRSHVFSFEWGRRMRPHAYQTMKTQLLALSGVQGISGSSNSIIDFGGPGGNVDWDGRPADQIFDPRQVAVDENFFSFFNIQLVQGEGFTGTMADSSRFVVNESAVKEMGLKHPLGTRYSYYQMKGTIVGVVKDFHSGSMREKIWSAVFFRPPNDFLSQMYVRTTGANAAAAIEVAAKLFKEYYPGDDFSYAFLDDSFNRLYQSEEREGTLFLCLAAIAILISCLGLFALAAYETHLRFREIGIRKVLGASVSGIVALLAKDFVRLVLLGIGIAVPVAWYAMKQWLAGFAYRTDLSWTVFLAAAVVTIGIALLTISFQSVKAALANPVASLKTE
ncbi:MAG TPA: ABC transporter permease [Puia sp.]|nr:ABC transporter permease [Puia sp.]